MALDSMEKIIERIEHPKSINKVAKRPVISLRIDPEVVQTFKAVCIEAGNIDRSNAIERILRYLIQPSNIETTKAIIRVDPRDTN